MELSKSSLLGLPWWCSGWESACQCRGHGFEPWFRKIPHVAEQLGPWATITEPARLEPVLLNKRGRDGERPAHRDEEWPPLAATRESPRTEMKTQHSHKLKKNKNKKTPFWKVAIAELNLRQQEWKQEPQPTTNALAAPTFHHPILFSISLLQYARAEQWCYSYISSWVPSMPFHSLSWHYLSHFLLQPRVLFSSPMSQIYVLAAFQYVLQYCTIWGWLNPPMQNPRYRRPIEKSQGIFRGMRQTPLSPVLFKGQLYI